jgi:hypothetical protein
MVNSVVLLCLFFQIVADKDKGMFSGNGFISLILSCGWKV